MIDEKYFARNAVIVDNHLIEYNLSMPAHLVSGSFRQGVNFKMKSIFALHAFLLKLKIITEFHL